MVLLLVRLVEGLRKEDFSPFSSISFAVLRSVCFDVASPRYLISNGLLSLSLSLEKIKLRFIAPRRIFFIDINDR